MPSRGLTVRSKDTSRGVRVVGTCVYGREKVELVGLPVGNARLSCTGGLGGTFRDMRVFVSSSARRSIRVVGGAFRE